MLWNKRKEIENGTKPKPIKSQHTVRMKLMIHKILAVQRESVLSVSSCFMSQPGEAREKHSFDTWRVGPNNTLFEHGGPGPGG